MKKYVAAGNTMTDSIALEDGTITESHMGGPSPFAYTGIRVWTDDCMMLTNVGTDYDEWYGEWMKNNDITYDGVVKMSDKTHHGILKYNPDGTYTGVGGNMEVFLQNLGYMDVRPSQFDEYTKDAKGVYVFMDCANMTWWKNLKKVKEKYGWELMWEYYSVSGTPENVPRIKEIIADLGIEMFSMNWPETKDLFELDDTQKETGIKLLSELGADMVFLRDGINGSYVITKDGSWEHFDMIDQNGVDPTGCGNSSTGTAMYAWVETHDPVKTGLMANISSSFNATYYGAITDLGPSLREKATKMYEKLLEEHNK